MKLFRLTLRFAAGFSRAAFVYFVLAAFLATCVLCLQPSMSVDRVAVLVAIPLSCLLLLVRGVGGKQSNTKPQPEHRERLGVPEAFIGLVATSGFVLMCSVLGYFAMGYRRESWLSLIIGGALCMVAFFSALLRFWRLTSPSKEDPLRECGVPNKRRLKIRTIKSSDAQRIAFPGVRRRLDRARSIARTAHQVTEYSEKIATSAGHVYLTRLM